MIESHAKEASFIVPGEVFAPENARTKKYEYNRIKDMHFFDMDTSKKQMNNFTTDATFVHNPESYSGAIPAEDLAHLMSLAMVTEHTKNQYKLDKKFAKKMNDWLNDLTAKNKEAFDRLNETLQKVNPA